MKISLRLVLIILLIAIITIYPAAILFQMSFQLYRPIPTNQPAQYTLDNFAYILGSGRFWKSLYNSAFQSIFRAIGAVSLGLVLAIVVTRTNAPWRRAIDVLAFIPIMMPILLTIIGWYFLAAPQSGLLNQILQSIFGFKPLNVLTMFGIVFVGLVTGFPLDYMVVYPALMSMDPSLEESAKVSGASTRRAFLGISLQIIRPAIFTVIIMDMVRGMGFLNLPLLFGQQAGISFLTTDIYFYINSRVPPNYGYGAVLAVLLMMTTIVGIYFYRRATAMTKKYVTVTGKGFRPHVLDLGRSKYLISALIIVFLVGIASLPAIVVTLTSLLPPWANYDWSMFSQFTLNTYNYLLVSGPQRDSVIRGIWNTIIMIPIAGLGTMFLAFLLSYLIIRTKLSGRGILHAMTYLPIGMPSIVVSLAIMLAFLRTPIYGTIWIIILAFVIRYLPIGMATTSPIMYQISPELEESSRTSGAGWRTTFRRIYLPLAIPTIISSSVFLMMSFVDELGTILLLRAPGNEVLATVFWNFWYDGSQQQAAAVGVIMLIMKLVLVMIPRIVERRVSIYQVAERTATVSG